jgi:hypothetical protein
MQQYKHEYNPDIIKLSDNSLTTERVEKGEKKL